MTLDDLLDLWEVDCKINDNHLDRESVRTPNLHAKYLRFLIQHKMKYAAFQAEYNDLRQRKFRYYRGEMGGAELATNKWPQWQGTKPLKNEMDEFLQGDSDLNKINIKSEYIKGLIEALESILGQIKSRDWTIRNCIEFKKFIAGN
jgi:hypothetical protein